jgi:hypothetical protein
MTTDDPIISTLVSVSVTDDSHGYPGPRTGDPGGCNPGQTRVGIRVSAPHASPYPGSMSAKQAADRDARACVSEGDMRGQMSPTSGLCGAVGGLARLTDCMDEGKTQLGFQWG